MRGYVREKRTTLASSFVVVVAAMALIAAAINGEAFRTPELKLHDAGVWIAKGKDQSIGRVNTQIAEADLRLKVDGAGADMNLLQADADVLVQTGASGGSLVAADGRTGELSGDPVALPSGALVGLGGPEGSAATLGVLDPASGEVWAGPAASVMQGTFVGENPDERSPASVTRTGAKSLAVGTDGVVRVFVPGSGEVSTIGVDGTPQATLGFGKRPEENKFEVSAVGSTAVVLDLTDSALLLEGKDPIELARFGANPRLQQPGVANSVVLVGTDDALLGVGLSDGSVQVIAEQGKGKAARPVYVRGCAWGAWGGSPETVRFCRGSSEATRSQVGLPAGRELTFRTNRGKVLINESIDGDAFVLGDGEPQKVDWSKAKTTEQQADDSETKKVQTTEFASDPKPPVANPDVGAEGFATRPGRAVVIDPLRNDSDPNGDVLVIDETISDLAPAGTVVAFVEGGRKLQVTPSAGSLETIKFQYTVNDGTGQPSSAPAAVDIRVQDPSVNTAPKCVRAPLVQETTVRVGSSVSHDVLLLADDAEGDVLSLDPLSVSIPAEQGTVTADPSGLITYRAPGTIEPTTLVIPYRIKDELGLEANCELPIKVSGLNEQRAPSTEPDHARTVVGQEAVVDVLANDSDPDGDALRVISLTPTAVSSGSVQIDAENRVRVTSDIAQPLRFIYTITDGPNTAEGILRVDVVSPSTAGSDPVAVRDDVVLRPGLPAVVDALANDVDPDGDVLSVQTVSVGTDQPLDVEILDRQFLRITASRGGVLDSVAQFTYVVTDGTRTSTGMVVVQPGPTQVAEQAPNTADDFVAVRVGAIAAVPVLLNDADPEGGKLSVALPAEGEQAENVRGKVFVQNELLRFQATDVGTFRIQYRAVDPAGYGSTAFAVVQVLPAETSNKAPQPSDLTARGIAGEEIVILVPVATMDPDGDPVTLLGVAPPSAGQAPLHGSVTSVEGDRMIYVPDAVDREGDGRLDGYFGTDTFTYQVRDAAGAVGQATVRIGIAPPPTTNSRPAAIDDTRSVAPGEPIRVDVVRNDSDPDGDELSIDTEADLRLPQDAPFRATIEDGRVVIDPSGLETGATASVTYTVTDGILTDTGLLTVTVVAAENERPVAMDDVWPAVRPGETVTIPVLDNDYDPDGEYDDLQVVSVQAPGAPAAGGREVTLVAPESDTVFVYEVKDASGATAKGVVVVPVLKGDRLRPVAIYDSATTTQGEPVSIAVLDNDVVSAGTEKVLLSAAFPRGGTCQVSGDKVTFEPESGFIGIGGCSYVIGDGPGDESSTLTSVGMVGVTVTKGDNTPPTFRAQPIEVVADSEVTVDLRAAVRDVDEGDADRVTFGQVKGEGSGVTATLDGSLLTVRAAPDAGPGVDLTVEARDPADGKVTGTVMVSVVKFSGDLPIAVADQARVYEGDTVNIQVLDNDQLGAASGGLRVVPPDLEDGWGVDPALAEITTDERVISFRPIGSFFGDVTFSYTVADSTGDVERYVQSTVTVAVVGRPGIPPAPTVVRESKAITLSWGVPPANGSPITGYFVKAIRADGAEDTRRVPSNAVRFDGLTNGVGYQFQIAAINEVVDLRGGEAFSPLSASITPNEIPTVPTGVLGTYVNTGGAIDVTWSQPPGEFSRIVRYEIEVSPGGIVSIDAPATSYLAQNLENGKAYTFRVRAINELGPDEPGISEWSAPSPPETPAQPPAAPLVPDTEVGDQAITVRWQQPADNGGAPITGYRLEYFKGGIPAGTATLSAVETSRVVQTENGADYTFRVQAENKAGLSAPSGLSAPVRSFGAPSPVASLTATEGDGSSTLTFPAPFENGTAITRYEYSRNAGGSWSPLPLLPGGGTTLQASVSAANGTAVTFNVRACNDRYCASNGAASNTVTPYGSPPAPGLGGTHNYNRTITWTWNEVAPNGRPIAGYEVSVNGGGWTGSNNGRTSHSITLGQFGEAATLQVRAVASGADPARTYSGGSNVVRIVVTKRLIADGNHWGCPGTYCGPSVSRLTTTSYSSTVRVVVGAGTPIEVDCWTTGQTITDPVNGTSTNLWVHTTHGDGYVWMSAHYFGTLDFNGVISGLRAC